MSTKLAINYSIPTGGPTIDIGFERGFDAGAIFLTEGGFGIGRRVAVDPTVETVAAFVTDSPGHTAGRHWVGYGAFVGLPEE